MGKSLEGKELGKGITQRQDGRYVARYTDSMNKRVQKVFGELAECQEWLKKELEYKEKGNFNVPSQITVDAWFDYWINIKKYSVREGTINAYIVRYNGSIKPFIGEKKLRSVTNIDCQKIMCTMAEKGYKNNTIGLAKFVLFSLLEYAYMSDVIQKNPCNKLVKSNIGKKPTERMAMTLREQRILCETIKGTRYELHYRFALQTGLRVGELEGLQWQDIDFYRRMLKVERAVKLGNDCSMYVGEPKSKSGYRKIPLTEEAIKILRMQKERNSQIKVVDFGWNDHIFLSEKGKPVKGNTYDGNLRLMCDRAHIPRVSMHILRHTFATRCIEAGMMPKTLQIILGHSDLAMTMDRYVHITDEQSSREMDRISSLLVV